MNRFALTARLPVLFSRLGLCLSLTAASVAHAAPQWKWKDADGRIQYSDRPPPASVSDANILERPRSGKLTAAPPTPTASAAEAAKAPAPKPMLKATDPQLEAKKRKADEEAAKAKAKATEDPKAAQARADSCQRARSYEKSLNDGIRISRTNAKGEREILDDAGRASELARTKEMITANCD